MQQNNQNKFMHMKNKLFYLFGAAFLLCSIGTFTACSDDDNGPVDNEEPPVEPWELNGEYLEGTKNVLKMTYNGYELNGKKVIIKTNEEKEKATITLEGTEKDLGAMLSGILGEIKITTSSPVPGEEKITLKDVVLTSNDRGASYTFEGEDTNSTRTMAYKGTIKNGELQIEIDNKLTNTTLAGTWNLDEVEQTGANYPYLSPLWFDWNTTAPLKIGDININGTKIENLDQAPNAIFLLLVQSGSMFNFDIENSVANMLKSITALPNGSIFAKYSYSGDINNPAWSEEMSHNIIRYYYGEESNRIYLEVNADFILNALLGLLTTTRASDSPSLPELIKPLIDILKPALEKGFPCTYLIEDGKMKINLDGEFTLDVMKKLTTLLNDPTINELLMYALESDDTLKQIVPNVKSILESLPDALTYREWDDWDEVFKGECKYIKIGLCLEKESK